jgi:hypothetical protein
VTHGRSIGLLSVLTVLGLFTGCKIDDRALRTSPPGSGTGGATGGDGGFGSGGSPLPTILLGDFENGTAQPQDGRFVTYQYYAYNPPGPSLPPGAFVSSPLVSPGYNSNYALGLNWEVIDVPDGVSNFPGVGVRTLANAGFVDLSGYDRIVFAQQYQHSGSCQAVQTLNVSIGCDELNTSYMGTVALSSTWTNSSLALSGFAEPSFAPPSGHTLAQCLALANRVDFQTQADLVDGACSSGSLALDNIEIRAGAAPPSQSGPDGSASTGIAIVPDGNGTFDGSNAAGVIGAWGSTGDYYGSDATAGTGTCPLAGFSKTQCSTIDGPTPGMPFVPDATARMCTSGVAAMVVPGDGGQPAYADIWGNFIFFDLNHPPAAPGDGGPDAGSGTMVYDAIAHGITGFAFDIDGTLSRLRVEFSTQGTETNSAYWDGATADVSPIDGAGHYEIRWADVGGPSYLSTPPPFDPSKLESIRFHVTSDASSAVSYSYCVKNTVLLTGP